MNRRLSIALLLLLILAAPVALVQAGLVSRSAAGLAALGNGLYIATALISAILPVWRWITLAQKKPLPGILTRQGLIICYIGLSGLLALAVFAPRFPLSARGAYLAGIGIIILFTLIPLGLLAYVRRKLP